MPLGEPLNAYRRPGDSKNVIRLWGVRFNALMRVIAPSRRRKRGDFLNG